MSRRLLSLRVLCAATLACVPAAEAARAQSAELRGTDSPGGFPGSPSNAPISSPEQNSPPSVDTSTRPQADDDGTPSYGGGEQPSRTVPNYGRPRKAKSNLYQPKRKLYPVGGQPNVPLSPLEPYRVPKKEKRPAGVPPSTFEPPDPRIPAPTVAAIPRPPPLRRTPVEDDPYAPVGIRTGELILKPFVEASTGYETNPNQVATGVKPSAVLRGDGGLDVTSDFSRHSLSASIRGGYSDFPSNSNANRPDFSSTIDGRIDVTRQDTIDTEARFSLATQTPGSPLLAVPNSVFIVSRPLITSEGATLGGTHLFGRLALGLKGTFDRTQYGDATQSDGTIYRYSQENYNDYGVVARAAYELTPAIIPFVEIGADTRVRDSAVDLSGYYRDSVGGTARAGATFDLIGHFTGSASAGYIERHYQDPRLQNLKGPSVDANLVYKATPLTTVTLRASTVASETTLAGASGALSRSFSAEVGHVLFRNFTLSGIATVQPNQYQGVQGNEIYLTFTGKAAYNFTREIQLIASASHQELHTTFYGQGFRDNIFLLGVRLQR